jgi:hypothetical protein
MIVNSLSGGYETDCIYTIGIANTYKSDLDNRRMIYDVAYEVVVDMNGASLQSAWLQGKTGALSVGIPIVIGEYTSSMIRTTSYR